MTNTFFTGLDANQQWALMLVAVFIAGIIGYLYRWYKESTTVGSASKRRDQIVEAAKREAEVIKREAMLEGRDQLHRERQDVEKELSAKKLEQKRVEDRLRQKQDDLERQAAELERGKKSVAQAEEALAGEKEAVKVAAEELKKGLEKLSRLSVEEAKAELMKQVEDEAKAESARFIRKIEEETEREADNKARRIVTIAMERYASEITTERTVSTVSLPSDDLKGRIIGREGRNIREFERLSGVDLVIDDTPQAVTLSCFDPVRREVARLALTRLVADGRIHPTRIEEVLEKAKKEIDQEIRKAADETAYELGIHNLRAELLNTIGRLKYRTSFGQNVLAHCKEVAHLGAMIAGEMGVDIMPVKRACLLHDIGKAVDHEVEGPHAMVGSEILKRYGEPPAVIAAVAGHHGDTEQTLEAMIVQVADAISASRPGVRMESAEMYIKRLESIEQIALAHEGVTKAYAIQAGREVRVFVNHEKIDDPGAKSLAKKVARKIESELSFPGQIRVTVIRETKYTEYAR